MIIIPEPKDNSTKPIETKNIVESNETENDNGLVIGIIVGAVLIVLYFVFLVLTKKEPEPNFTNKNTFYPLYSVLNGYDQKNPRISRFILLYASIATYSLGASVFTCLVVSDDDIMYVAGGFGVGLCFSYITNYIFSFVHRELIRKADVTNLTPFVIIMTLIIVIMIVLSALFAILASQ